MAHTCHWPGCDRVVSPKMWGCKEHWFTLPASIRAKIWATYVPGQEVRKDPSVEYLKVADEARTWAINHEAVNGEVKAWAARYAERNKNGTF